MIESVVNFRDFGGLPSRHGGRVVRDRLYRSGAPATIGEHEMDRLFGLDFVVIADLRYAGERDHEPSPWPVAYADRVLAHNGGRETEAPHMAPLREGTMTEAECDRIYVQLYRDMPYDPLYRPLFGRVLASLTDTDGRALIHCSAGKDRTGVTVALIHHVLGVSRDDIFEDYMKSRADPGLLAMAEPTAARMAERYGHPVALSLMRRLLDVDSSWLGAFFDEIEQRSGSVDAYLEEIGMTEDRQRRLRARLLAA